MDENQQQFYNFYMSMVKEEKQDEAKLILLKNFKMQDEGTFSREIMDEVFPKMLALIKPENQLSFKEAAEHFSTKQE